MDHAQTSRFWHNVVSLLEKEMTDLSLKTWIQPMEAVSADRNVLVLAAPNDFHKGYVDLYLPLIRNAVRQIAGEDYEIRVVLTGQDAPQVPDTSPAAFNGQGLNPNYSFANFVVGSGNRFAHAACVSIAEKTAGNNFNPLFIYGGSGLGKTHLMHAIGNHVKQKHPSCNLVYVQSERFVNEFINTITEGSFDSFRNKYRNAGMLLIDDIQFIEGKVQMQEEFFHTFNSLYEGGKNIIMTCDKPPNSLATLEERLRTRFASGLIVDIQPPDYETRLAILRRRSQDENVVVPEDVFDYIAAHIATNIRELEGALKTVMYYSMLAGELSLETAQEALKDLVQPMARVKLSPDAVTDIVARYYNMTMDDIKSSRRSKDVSNPRQIAMYICRRILNMSFPEIGVYFGGRDHSTVMHACDKITSEINSSNAALIADINGIKKRLSL